MSPNNVMDHAIIRGLDIIAITDHNSLKNVDSYKKVGEKFGITVIGGVEITTKEEIHALCLFESQIQREKFQDFIDAHISKTNNNPDLFGYQVVIDENEEITEQIDHLLLNACDKSINDISEKVYSLNGIFIPAHINRQTNSILSQLGFIPPDLKFDALGLSSHISEENFRRKHPELSPYRFIQNSDAHFPEDIGKSCNLLSMKTNSFEELRMAIRGENGRNNKTIQDNIEI
jgi:PHP family Zn ribbon phosphoesterase